MQGTGGLKRSPGSVSVEQHGFGYLEPHELATYCSVSLPITIVHWTVIFCD